MKYQTTLFFYLSFFLSNVFCNYEGRKWVRYPGRILQIANLSTYARSPFVLYGRGYQILLSGYARETPSTYIDYRYEYNGIQQAWSVHAVMSPPDAIPYKVADTDGSKFGHWITGGGTFETKTFFAVTASLDDYARPISLGNLSEVGSVYIYHGEYSRWTNTQKLRPEIISKGGIRFGSCAAICPKNPYNMIIGAEGEQSGSELYNAGAAFFYRSSDTKKWSQTQKLMPDHVALLDRFGFITGIYDEFLFVSAQGDDDTGINSGSLYIFREERAFGLNLWSQQQKLHSPMPNVKWFSEYTQIYGHTLVVGSSEEDDYGGMTNTGAVYVYKTFETLEDPYIPPPHPGRELSDRVPPPKPPPRMMFKWWSCQQRLTARDWHPFRFFGRYTSLGGNGNLIAVGAYGESWNDTDWSDAGTGPFHRTGSSYIFVKDNHVDRWSQQQKFLGPNFPKGGEYFADPFLDGSDLIIRDSTIGYAYTDKLEWKCLQIAVSDHFGDGWDHAYLMGYAPSGLKFTKVSDHYTPYCTSPNPLKFRYCPLLDEDIGEYTFKLSSDVFKRKFWGEIRWSIHNEKDNKWYFGDAHSSITFRWIQELRQFDHAPKPGDRLFDNNRCVSCSPDFRVTPKPGPGSLEPKAKSDDHRLLKGVDDSKHHHTRAPTYSPAPTVVYDSNTDWALMTMKTTSLDGWWGDLAPWGRSKNGTGTSYYVYDETGKILIYTGTICSNGTAIFKDACHLELADGNYILRVGGAVDPDASLHTWSFCGIEGKAQEMITFSVLDRDCTPITRIPVADYCLSTYILGVTVSGVIELRGLVSFSLTDVDLEVIGEAIKSMTTVYVTSVKVELVDSSGIHLYVKFSANIDASPLGLNGINDADSETVFELFESEILSMSASGKLTSNIIVLSEMTRTDSNTLMNLLGAQITSVMNAGPNFHDVVTTQYEPINFFNKEEKNSHVSGEPLPTVRDEFMERTISLESSLGYGLLFSLLILGVGVAWRLSVRDNIRLRKPYVQVPQSEPLISGPQSTSISPESYRTKRSKEVMATIMEIKDGLKKMVETEDEIIGKQVSN